MLWIAIPTRNEASIIRANLERLLAFLRHQFPDAHFHDRRNRRLVTNDDHEQRLVDVGREWRVVVADNASTDDTRAIVREVATTEPRVELLKIPETGKGGAVLAAWKKSSPSSSPGEGELEGERRLSDPHLSLPSPPSPRSGAGREGAPERMGDVFVFMDADLATDLAALPALIATIQSGADIAVGSRNLPGSQSERGIGRRAISRCYRLLLRLLFDLRVSDPPCGFKAVNERVVREIVPQVSDRQWFFDTELLIRAQRAGLRIAKIPVTWHEPRRGGSLRKVLRIITSDLRAMWELWWSLRGTK